MSIARSQRPDDGFVETLPDWFRKTAVDSCSTGEPA